MKEASALMAVLVHDFTGEPIDAEVGARDVAWGGGGMIHACDDDELPPSDDDCATTTGL